jgi:hypothetical protein
MLPAKKAGSDLHSAALHASSILWCCIIENMSYQIRPVDFQNGIPDNDKIIEFIENNTSQRVTIKGLEFSGQYSVSFENYPKDELEFSRKDNNITIYGDAGAAPALFEIFYSSLVLLGGDQKHEIDLVNFPVSDEYIMQKNREMRSLLRKAGTYIWALILLMLTGIGSLVYLFLRWVINA